MAARIARRATAAVVGVVLAAVPTAVARPLLSKATFTAKGNAICRTANAESDRAAAKLKDVDDLDQLATFLTAEIKISERERGRLQKLVPPRSLRAPFKRFLAAGDQTLRIARKMRAAARRHDKSAVNALADDSERADRAFRARARAAGLRECAKG